MAVTRSGFLAPYRVLDLTDHRGLLAGHMMAQLGADVVQLEPPGGNVARRQPPFADAWPLDDDSLFWAAYAAGKRSRTCAPSKSADMWRALIEGADFLFESHAPSEGRPMWLSPEAIAAINPAIVHVTITPFGMTGPKRDWHDSEITMWAAGGPLLLTRDLDGKPLRISVPQAYLHAAAAAAGAALIAHAERSISGRGQHVDVSVLQCLPQCTLGAVLAGSVGHPDFVPRPRVRPSTENVPDLSGSGSLTRRSKWPIADGLAEMHLAMGPATGGSTNKLFAWMHEVDAIDPRFADWDWTTLHKRISTGDVSEEQIEQARTQVAAFLSKLRKRDLMQVAIDRGVRIAPIETIADLDASTQFAARNFIRTVTGAHGTYRIPGPFAHGCNAAFVDAAGAPGIGGSADDIVEEWQPRPAVPTNATSSAPFAGMKVLDLAWVVAGPLIGRNLADFGATVVRVESSKRVETARLMGPFPKGRFDVQQSALYETCNAGKLGLSLDLSRPDARDIVRDLVRWADVVVESFTPGQMAKWGLSYDELVRINPALIMVSTSLTGQTGPYRAYSGYGNHGAAISGFQNIVGSAGQPPVGPYGPYTDFVAPRFGLVATLAALDWRRRTGRGCHLDVSQTEAGVQFLAAQIADYSVTGQVQVGVGNRDLGMAPHGVFRCAGDDEWIAIAARSDAEWHAIATYVGGAELVADMRFATLEDRKCNEEVLEEIVAGWTIGRDALDIEGLLQVAGVAAHHLVSLDDFATDPQIIARQALLSVPHPLSGEAVIEATPFRLSRTPAIVARSAPPFGRDNEEVLRSILHLDPDRIAALSASGALS